MGCLNSNLDVPEKTINLKIIRNYSERMKYKI